MTIASKKLLNLCYIVQIHDILRSFSNVYVYSYSCQKDYDYVFLKLKF